MSEHQHRTTVPAGATRRTSLVEVGKGIERRDDLVAAEEPLELRVVADDAGQRKAHSIAVTMRTPGHDFELAAGFLLSEGVVSKREQLWRLARCSNAAPEEAENIVEAHLAPGVDFDVDRFSRHVYTTSSCGVCGKASIDLLVAACPVAHGRGVTIAADVVRRLPATLRQEQTVFSRTGGLHAAGLFAVDGSLLRLREDVGRHNALDKLIGRGLLDEEVPLSSSVALVSGRTSFELVQKALAAGLSMLLAVGAPSSLAVETAQRCGMTLVGFLKPDGFNVYSGEHRIV